LGGGVAQGREMVRQDVLQPRHLGVHRARLQHPLQPLLELQVTIGDSQTASRQQSRLLIEVVVRSASVSGIHASRSSKLACKNQH